MLNEGGCFCGHFLHLKLIYIAKRKFLLWVDFEDTSFGGVLTVLDILGFYYLECGAKGKIRFVFVGLMDHTIPREKDFEVDLESGVTISEENSSKVPVSGAVKQAKTLLGKICSRFVDGSINSEDTDSLCGNVLISDGVSPENVKVVNNKVLEGEQPKDYVEKTPMREKRKKTSNKKAPKPPRPPRGPSLDAADQKLIREISELAMLKRARIERMKALKKMKASKSQSSNSSSIFAMVLTVLFCLVVIFQGMSSKTSSPVSFQGSPVSARATEGGLISVQYYAFPSASEPDGPGSGSPNLVEQIAGSDPSEKLTRVVG